MKSSKTIFACAVVGLFGISAHAQGTAFTYQGRLDGAGGPASGYYDMAFGVFDTNAPGGVLISGPVTNSAVAVNNGLFTVTLDFGGGVFTGSQRWLEIAVRTNGGGSFDTLTPRQQITAAPYAIMANSASNLLGTLPSANLSGTYGNAVTFDNGANAFRGEFSGNGSGLTNLNASGLTSGTVPIARLPGNIAFVNSNQTFTAQNVFEQPVGFGNPSPLFPIDVMAAQAVGRFISTNSIYGAVIEMRNLFTSDFEYLGAINFNNKSNVTPGQISYTVLTPTNQNFDTMEFRVGGYTALRLQADSRGMGAASSIGGFPGNSISSVNLGGSVIAGGGYGGGYNMVLSNTSGVFIGAGSANQIGPNLNDSVIGGGYGNTVQSGAAMVGGGAYNTIAPNAAYAFIGAGNGNNVGSFYGFIGNGYYNAIQSGDGGGSVIGGGYYHTIASNIYNGVIGGGYYNNILSDSWYTTIAGGAQNTMQTNTTFSTIGGGYFNTISENATEATIAGGKGNVVQSTGGGSFIGGGAFNRTAGSGSVVPGGFGNQAIGVQSFAAGTKAYADYNGTFVFADNEVAEFHATAINQFSGRFRGGVRFVTEGAGMTIDDQNVFVGSNAGGLTNLNASQLTGTVSLAQLPSALVTNNQTGVTLTGTFSGDGSGLTGLNAGQLTGTVPGGALFGTYTNLVNFLNPANGFAGNGTGLTNLNASELRFGFVPLARLPSAVVTNTQTGVTLGGTFSGNGSGLTNLSASELKSGTVPLAQLPSALVTNTQTGVTLSGTFNGNGGGLTNLNATELRSGTVSLARLPSAVVTNTQTGVTLGGTFSGNGSGLTNLSASELKSGTVAFAQLPSALVTNNQTGVTLSGTFSGNGTGLTNVNAALLNGSSSTAFAPASGSINYIQNQNSLSQSASFDITGDATVGGTVDATSVTATSLTVGSARITGLIRSGSETGSSNAPSPAGLVIRRANSTFSTISNVVARTDVLTLERDGTSSGLLIRYAAGVPRQTINCLAQSFFGTNIITHATLNSPGSPGTIQLVTGTQRAVHVDISFGNTYNSLHVTHVVLDRYDDGVTSDNFWVGTLTSTYNQ